ncbi:MAG: hypothetical protein M3R30_07870 [Candidatus Eremiobacteraeota bacterium]|nr:hypothetical protein [Candidatus Eremiobacteraeota bacterium]
MIPRTLVATLVATVLAFAQASAAAPSNLQAITDRGRAVYDYDQAAGHATDAVLGIAPQDAPITMYVGHKTQAGLWVFAFGGLSKDGTTFDVLYEGTQSATDPLKYDVASFGLKPRHDAGASLAMATAAIAARAAFNGEKRAYNIAVLPRTDGQIYVYVYPGTTSNDSYPLGGDERFLYSADGKTQIEATPLHKSIIEMPLGSSAGATAPANMNNEVLFDVPQDTDVLMAMTTKLPGYIVARGHMYLVNIDGSIVDKGLAAH